MKTYMVQIKVYGYTTIVAEDWDAATEEAEELTARDFDMSNDCDIDVINEMDDVTRATDLRVEAEAEQDAIELEHLLEQQYLRRLDAGEDKN